MEEKRRIKRLLPAFLTGLSIVFIAFLQFYKLGELPVVQWDESRLSVNAAEMHSKGFSAISTFEGKPDHYNTKPPLMIWLQFATMKAFGISEFAIRLPSAVAGFICILFCGFIAFRITGSLVWGSFTAVTLAVSDGFIQLHGSMTGDYDALLCVFLLPAAYFLHQFLDKKKRKDLVLFGVYMALAVMSKSAAAIITYPVFMAAALTRQSMKTALQTAFCLLISTMPFILFCLYREHIAPGYLNAMVYNDFLGRYTEVIDGHSSEWHYYLVNLIEFRYSYLIYLLPLSFFFVFKKGEQTLKYYALLFCLHLILLSTAGTRIHWYDMPLLPLISVIISLGLFRLSEVIHNKSGTMLILFAAWILVLPAAWNKYRFISERYGMKLDMGHLELSRMLRSHDCKENGKYLAGPYDAEFYFYTLSNPCISRGNLYGLNTGDIVMYGNRFRDSIPLRYHYTTIDSTTNAFKIRIQGNKIR